MSSSALLATSIYVKRCSEDLDEKKLKARKDQDASCSILIHFQGEMDNIFKAHN